MSEAICERCGFKASDHWLVNYADGPHVSRAVLLCPAATFFAKGYDDAGLPLKPKRESSKIS